MLLSPVYTESPETAVFDVFPVRVRILRIGRKGPSKVENDRKKLYNGSEITNFLSFQEGIWLIRNSLLPLALRLMNPA